MSEGLRPIDVSHMQPVTLTPQPAPQLLWIDVDRVVIDEKYQRPMAPGNWSAVRRIADNFRWSRFSPVIVAPIEGGRYAVIDGQHRCHAALLCGITSIPAMVALIAPAEQASAFIEINTKRISVRSNTIYRAALTAGEAWAVACRDAVEAAGCQMMANMAPIKDRRPAQVYAVDLIRRLVDAGHGAAVTAGLTALREYDPDSVANFSADMLTPWLGAAAKTCADAATLLATLRSKRPWLVLEVADRMATADGKPRSACRVDAFCVAIWHQTAAAIEGRAS